MTEVWHRIVYRDGELGLPWSREASDRLLPHYLAEGTAAYRLRIRLKPTVVIRARSRYVDPRECDGGVRMGSASA